MEGKAQMTAEVRALNTGELRFIMDGGKPRIDGRAILFDSWSVDLGGFRERMLPGSVTLDADLVGLFDHNSAMVLGRTSAGTMEVRSDERGVAFTAYPPETSWANDLRVSMERGDIKGCSYRMMVQDDKWYVDASGMVCRDVIKASISELTVTSMPAYPETTAEARSHAQALAMGAKAVEERVGRTLSADNITVLKGVFQNLELASDTLEGLIAANDPTFNEDDYGLPDSEGEGMPDAGKTPGQEIVAGVCPDCGNMPCTCDMQSSVSMDGSSTSSRSADGASATPTAKANTFAYGFGFIPTRKDK